MPRQFCVILIIFLYFLRLLICTGTVQSLNFNKGAIGGNPSCFTTTQEVFGRLPKSPIVSAVLVHQLKKPLVPVRNTARE